MSSTTLQKYPKLHSTLHYSLFCCHNFRRHRASCRNHSCEQIRSYVPCRSDLENWQDSPTFLYFLLGTNNLRVVQACCRSYVQLVCYYPNPSLSLMNCIFHYFEAIEFENVIYVIIILTLSCLSLQVEL